MKLKSSLLPALFIGLALLSNVFAQTSANVTTTDSAETAGNTNARSLQNIANSLSSLPQADTVIYFSPQRILNEAAPKLMAPADTTKMRDAFSELQKGLGIDPSKLDYLAIAVRFNKPTGDLSFVAPDVLTVFSGDFNAASLINNLRASATDLQLRDETYGSKTLTLMTIEDIAEEAQTNPLLKSFVQIGIAPLTTNTLAVGSGSYLKQAVDAADGKGQISSATITSLLRDPNTLVSAAGYPLTAFGKSFGLMGTEAAPRDPKCFTGFGNFYAGISMGANSFSLRGAMNVDNPDTAKIMNSILLTLLQQVAGELADQSVQNVLKQIRMSAKESEIVWEGDIPNQLVADFIKEAMKPAPPPPAATATPGTTTAPAASPATPAKPARRPVRKRRAPVKKSG
ncbi:MAG TPA: hypothetical protein VKB46_29070, partial [Pyrinomonadaceae bacterium]|nr:hypothetical protein [Pyrinomonadaceae bacterium]